MVEHAVTQAAARPGLDVVLRHPTEADHARLVGVIDEWWGGRRMRARLPRLWLRHFATTSWIAEIAGGADNGRLAGFLVGFVGPDDPEVASIHLLAVDPNLRRRAVGRTLVERFCSDVGTRGARRVESLVRPDERPAVAFARALGFDPVVRDAGSWIAARPLYGVPAFEDWDGPGEDRALLVRNVGDVAQSRGARGERA
jgi:ribosomal protein S18 acetylase RimI-like enzyme